MKVDVCFSPLLFDSYATKNAIALVVDIFRATTSICTALHNGATAIKTTASLTEAMHEKELGVLVAAERNTLKCNFADFGNSPFDFTSDRVNGKEIVFTTTNGTSAIEAAKNAEQIIIGAFSNITTVADYCCKKNKNIIIVCSGWNNRFCLEDTLFAGALIEKLFETEQHIELPDAAKASFALWKVAKANLLAYICGAEHYQRLKKNGLENDVSYCLTSDTTSVLPRLDRNSGTITL